jgi:cell migration-inducing and hyaluronan-binding protein
MLLPLALCLVSACGGDLATLAAGPVAAHQRPAQADGLRWSDRKSWPDDRVPAAGADVVIPEGTRIVLDVSPPELRSLVVRGTLALPTGDVAARTLVAGHIEVHGHLEAGTERRPYDGRLTITLTGRSDAQNLAYKALSVFPGGTLDLHARARLSWTRLARTAEPGATQLVLAETPDWSAGDRIVVAPSGFSQAEAEMRTVRDVDGTTVTLDEPLAHRHEGAPLSIAGIAVERRAEVGLLSRGIRIEGDEASDESGQGGHVIVFQGGVARVDGVEFHRMGQRGELARYPMHWHMADRAPGQYIVRSSVWRSYNRCVTVHGTHDVTVADNVCYDHTGHGFFLEDGIETNNTITGNLGLLSRPGSVIPSDHSPSTFWVTHPDNTVEENVAAGSASHGFWYAVGDHPTGPSATTAVWPRFTPLRSFRGNVAHAIHGDALHVEGADSPGSYSPRSGAAPNGEPVVARFEDFTVYASSRAYWSRGDHIRLENPLFVDNFVAVQAGEAGGHAEGELVGGLVAGWMGDGVRGGPATRHGVLFYDGPVHVRDVTFANFDRPGSAALSSQQTSAIVSGLFSVERSRFVDARPVLLPTAFPTDGERMSQLVDRDGSVTGFAGARIVPNDPFLLDERCEARPDWNAHVCRGGYAAVLLEGPDLVAPAAVASDDGRRTHFGGYTSSRLQFPVRTGHGYAVTPDARTRGAYSIFVEGLEAEDWITVTAPISSELYRGLMHHAGRAPVPAVKSRAALDRATTTTAYFDLASGLVHVKFVGEAGHDRLGVYMYGD